jgi:hypothetical protein
MDPLDLTQLFVERCERSAPASELKATFQIALEHMGFRYFACCSHVNPKHPPRQAVVLHNYPSSWARTFAEQNLHERDPVFLRAESEILPFHWNAPEFRATLSPSQKRILQEAARNGVAHGYTVPLHLPWAAGALRASCSVVPDSTAISPRAYREVQVMATYLYASVGYHEDVRAARETAMRGAHCSACENDNASSWQRMERAIGTSVSCWASVNTPYTNTWKRQSADWVYRHGFRRSCGLPNAGKSLSATW